MRPDTVLETLQQAGFEAWYAGGCVRDTLLGRPVHDWDVTTAALPEQVMALFPKTVPTGLKHGTVTVLCGGEAVEVTTFRTETGYHDGRHAKIFYVLTGNNSDFLKSFQHITPPLPFVLRVTRVYISEIIWFLFFAKHSV